MVSSIFKEAVQYYSPVSNWGKRTTVLAALVAEIASAIQTQ